MILEVLLAAVSAGVLGLLILGFSAIKAVLDIPLWVPLAFLALTSLAGAAAERSGGR